TPGLRTTVEASALAVVANTSNVGDAEVTAPLCAVSVAVLFAPVRRTAECDAPSSSSTPAVNAGVVPRPAGEVPVALLASGAEDAETLGPGSSRWPKASRAVGRSACASPASHVTPSRSTQPAPRSPWNVKAASGPGWTSKALDAPVMPSL